MVCLLVVAIHLLGYKLLDMRQDGRGDKTKRANSTLVTMIAPYRKPVDGAAAAPRWGRGVLKPRSPPAFDPVRTETPVGSGNASSLDSDRAETEMPAQEALGKASVPAGGGVSALRIDRDAINAAIRSSYGAGIYGMAARTGKDGELKTAPGNGPEAAIKKSGRANCKETYAAAGLLAAAVFAYDALVEKGCTWQ